MDQIRIFQFNLHKSYGCQANLLSQIGKDHMTRSLYLLQEPHFYGDLPTSFTKSNFQILKGKGKDQLWPRAIIVASKDLKVSLVESLTTRDCTCIIVHTQGKEIIVVSSYQDITTSEATINIDKCCSYAQRYHKEIVIGSDSNSHSALWKSNETNLRGEQFENLIAQHNLTVCNTGGKHTFDAGNRKSIIDVTLSSLKISESIKSWTVHDQDYLSDHKLISFSLDFNPDGIELTRNFDKANWKRFNSILTKCKVNNKRKIWSKETIELEVKDLMKTILHALDKVCPEHPRKCKTNNVHWWNTELHNLRKRVDNAFKHWKRNFQDPIKEKENRDSYTALKKEYFNEIRRAKAASWKKFTHECTDIYNLNKIIQRKQLNQVSLMEGCISAKESLRVLMDNHFPGSKEVKTDLLSETTGANSTSSGDSVSTGLPHNRAELKTSYLDESDHLKFLDPGEVKRAFHEMKALNSGGPDALKAIVFQHLPDNIIIKISQIYKACLILEYTPRQWSISNVIFLAKPNRDRYDSPGAFRPISMFNVLIKGLEKLVKWEIERKSLSNKPLHKEQHAFCREKGTDTALVKVVDTIEKGLLRNKFTLGVFIDIAGAFNNLNTEKALMAMKNRGIPGYLVSWFESFVTNRTAQSELLGAKTIRKLNMGTPQGGVLSPLFWNIPFDELLVTLNNIPGITAIGFADDLVLLITGVDEATLSNIMQQAIIKAKIWLEKYGLSISPSKSATVMFTHKRNWKKFPLKIDRVEIPFKEEVKYLGITLDHKLRWRTHVSNKIDRAKRHLMAFHKAITLKYGPNPILMKRAYTTIVVPALTYGCHVWGDRGQLETIRHKLDKINRLACLLIGKVAPSTPTKGMEIYLILCH